MDAAGAQGARGTRGGPRLHSRATTVPVLLMFFAGLAVVLSLVICGLLPPLAFKPVGLWFVLVAAIASLAMAAEQTRTLNCIAAALVVMLVVSAASWASTVTGLPFGNVVYTSNAGSVLGGRVPLALPVLWVAVVFMARQLARAIMRPWRKHPYYGFWVIGITCVLGVMFEFNAAPITTRTFQLRMWDLASGTPAWYGVPWINFSSWAVLLLLLMLVVTPVLVPQLPTQAHSRYYPLIGWGCLHLPLFVAAGAGAHWPALGVLALSTTATMILALRGARW